MRREPFASETINIDRDGLRVTPGGPANPMRILSLFGGSTNAGTGVDDAHTISALVQRLFPDAAVVNYGQSAFVSAQNCAALLKRISLGAPVGTVVFYDGINDVLHLCQAGIRSMATHSRTFSSRRHGYTGISSSEFPNAPGPRPWGIWRDWRNG